MGKMAGWLMPVMFAVGFTTAFVVFRVGYAAQQAGYLPADVPGIAIWGEHVHHWMVGLVLLPAFTAWYLFVSLKGVKHQVLFHVNVFILAFIAGMVIDGLIGYGG